MTIEEVQQLLRQRIAEAWAEETRVLDEAQVGRALYMLGQRTALESVADEIERRVKQEVSDGRGE